MHKLLLASILALGAAGAQAAENGFYLGAGISESSIDGIESEVEGGDFDFEDTAWKGIVGFRPIDLFAVELSYTDLGSEEGSVGPVGFSADATAISGFAVGFLPIPLPILDIYGKAGLTRWELDGSFSGLTVEDFDESGTEFAWGGGAQLNIGALGVRLEYENFDIDDTDGLELYTLGVTFTL